MSGNSGAGYGKDPLTPCHGDSLVDQSFQSLKSKEIRDSTSPPYDVKFHSTTLNHPNTTGWDVQTSSEVSPDGRAYRTETRATTDGVERINGGVAEFKGLNEQRASASHQGDDKNFVKKASESSNTQLQENVVIGDEKSGRIEKKMSSTTTSSSSQMVSSSTTSGYDDQPQHGNRYLTDNTSRRQVHDQRDQRDQHDRYYQQPQHPTEQYEENRRVSDQSHVQRSQQQQQHQYTEEYNRERQESQTQRNVESQQTREQTKRYIDVDKASPEYQQHVQYLMSQPGEIISNTVEYPKPNVKMITTVKRLPDGTIVRNKRYETEELTPTRDTTRQRTTSSASNQSNTQKKTTHETREQHEKNIRSQQQHVRENTYTSPTPSGGRPDDYVDRPQKMVQPYSTDRYPDEEVNVSKSVSSVKKSSRRFSTETTSETIEEYDDRSPSGKPRKAPQAFSTHGFPSVRPDKPTQEYASERPQTARPSNDFTTQGFPSVKPNKPTQEYPTDRPQPQTQHTSDTQHTTKRIQKTDVEKLVPQGSPTVRKITTPDGEVIVVSSEKSHTSKYQSNSQRVVEQEITERDNYSPEKITYTSSPHKPDDFSTHGFPSVKPNKLTQEYPTDRPQPEHTTTKSHHTTEHTNIKDIEKFVPQGAPGSPSVRTITTPEGEVIVVSSEKTQTHTSKYQANSERVIERETTSERDTKSPQKGIYPTPSQQPDDFSTHGFPSVRDTAPRTPETPRQGTPFRASPSKTLPSRYQPEPLQPARPTTRTQDEVIVVSSQTQKNAKQKTSTERIIETEVIDSDYPSQAPQRPGEVTYITTHRRPDDFTTHGFPSVKGSSPERSGSPRKPQGRSDSPDYSTHGFPSVKSPTKTSPDYSTHGFPSVKSPTKTSPDYSTHGFPSVKSPTKTTPDYSSHGFPSARDTNKPKPTQSYPTKPRPSTTTSTPRKSTTTETTQRLIQKEKEVDAAHRAFAASLRSSSPADSVDHPRHTPRSSISSTRTYRRDMREGSHDSAATAPSESSRFSSSTTTRSSPSKHVGKTVVTKQTVVKTRNVNGSNETLDLTPQRSVKSPSPTKTATTTTTRTTTTTTTRKTPTEVPKSDNQKIKPAENQFPINESLTITKNHISTNDASFPRNEVVEEPCIKKHFYLLGPSDNATNTTNITNITNPTNASNTANATTSDEKGPKKTDLTTQSESTHKNVTKDSQIKQAQNSKAAVAVAIAVAKEAPPTPTTTEPTAKATTADT